MDEGNGLACPGSTATSSFSTAKERSKFCEVELAQLGVGYSRLRATLALPLARFALFALKAVRPFRLFVACGRAEGKVLYKGTAETMDSVERPGERVTAYRFMHEDGSYIGRSSALPSRFIRLGGISEKQDEVMIVRDTGDNIVLKVQKDPSQFWITHWQGTIESRGVTGFGDVRSVPMADPLFVSFLVSMQFRNTGLFSPLTTCILLLVLSAAVYYMVRKRQLSAHGYEADGELLDLAELLPGSSPLAQPGCCAGNRPR